VIATGSLKECTVTNRSLLYIAMMAVLILCACSRSPQLAPLPADAVVLAFGDSLTFGTGARPEESYPAVLERLIGKKVVNAGVPGEVTAEGKARLPALLDEHRPALVIICLGGNDFLRRLDEKETEANLREMVAAGRDHGSEVLLLAVPRLGFGLEVPDMYRRIATDVGIPLERKALNRILGDKSLKSDPIHPNATGYRELAEAVAKELRRAGAIP
jgi:acyl-CoA thioesterase I